MIDADGKLSEFQKELLEMANNLPKESKKIMRKIGSKARTLTARRARREVNQVTGNYIGKGKKKYGFKRGKVFIGDDGEWVVRVYNSSPHAHLIEHGHRMVTKDGKEVGFVEGKHVLEKAMSDFDQSGTAEDMLSDWLDEMLEDGIL